MAYLERRARVLALAGLLLLAVACLALLLTYGDEPLRLANRLSPAHPMAPTVVFVVLDNVRADHTSACGYHRPNTPTLAKLAESGALTCTALAPGSWSLPSHASYFTGKTVAEHGAHFMWAGGGNDPWEVVEGGGNSWNLAEIRAMKEHEETLAETYAARGYQTSMITANPVLGRWSGLAQGVDRLYEAPDLHLRGQSLQRVMDQALWEADRDRPLYLFVNIMDAHFPWAPIPEGVGWVPPRPGMDHEIPVWFAEIHGTSQEAEWLDRRTDAIDYGTYVADQALGGLLERLREAHWDRAGLRLIVASDHGEHLGERGIIDHGRYLFEANSRVFVLHHEEGTGHDPAPIPEGLDGRYVHSLVRDGVLPPERSVARAVAFPDLVYAEFSGGRYGVHHSAALWTREAKWMWMDGEVYKLPSQPVGDEELEAARTEDQPPPELLELVSDMYASEAAPVERDPNLTEMLRAVGYLQ
jgi:arylsulfatase A-like enzyme